MVEWIIDQEQIPYEASVKTMEQRVESICNFRDTGEGTYEAIWLLEHPPLYTAGTSAKATDLLDSRFPVHKTGRGGEHTYHGPGQRIAYVMLDLRTRQKNKPDLRAYIWSLEEWIIQTLATFDVKGERREGRVGIWVDMQKYGGRKGEEAKIAAIGVRIRKWVAYHGISINRDPNLSHFGGIVPCGIAEHGVTSLKALGKDISPEQLDTALQETFSDIFN